MNKKINAVKARRKFRVGKNIIGSAIRPRLSVYRSLTGIYAQLIDDATGNTLVAASSNNKEIEAQIKDAKSKIDKSLVVGEFLAKCAIEKNINTVVFDRNGFRYHGRVKALADGARKGGLKF